MKAATFTLHLSAPESSKDTAEAFSAGKSAMRARIAEILALPEAQSRQQAALMLALDTEEPVASIRVVLAVLEAESGGRGSDIYSRFIKHAPTVDALSRH